MTDIAHCCGSFPVAALTAWAAPSALAHFLKLLTEFCAAGHETNQINKFLFFHWFSKYQNKLIF
jgi:hypothetical protein